MANIVKSDFSIFNQELGILSRDYLTEDPIISTKIFKIQEKGIFKKENEIKKSYVSRKGEYISLLELCYLIENYTKYIYNSVKEFRKNLEKSICKIGERIRYFRLSYEKRYETFFLNFGIIKANIAIPSLFIDYDYIDRFSIRCEKIPVLSEGSEELYNVIKDDVYNFLPYIYSYQNYKEATCSDTNIGETATLNIKDIDALNNKGTMVTIRFGELAIIEININNNELKISSFSRDTNTNLYLKDHGNELFEKIFINKASIENILNVINICK